MRVKFLLYSIERAKNINRAFLWIGKLLIKVFPSTQLSLAQADLDVEPENYLTASFFSAAIYFIVFFSLIYGLLFLRDNSIVIENGLIAFLAGVLFFILFLFLHAIYPGIVSKQQAQSLDNTLVFALKSIAIQVGSGVSLFQALNNISKSNYGVVSQEFKKVVQDISSGESEIKSIEQLALRTKSEYLKKTSWQLITALRSGASITGAINSVVQLLVNSQYRAIKNYISELNLWLLMYLLFAAAVPALGITFLVILSAIGGSSIGEETIYFIVFIAFIVQIIMISLVKTRIPAVIS
ncbi:MAG: type II secretion system F family protein [Candidatus Diapherotrites archaeon]|nr:type II secretion system F family protein [Candidatus Diapherotrites archaeon]